ncbi:hypothetical protein H257_15220 [Aphanomyces astaci]|uniref:Uncharacterized protein n=1 Tax=Aphanomyces astaci TaxID=112090 RepID=W4FNQ9_APHAT|nr:hypothetical protein H257_15220 [Aphanomyces astaci]ETV69085.1 hypothetical protein H257_15220 [Aphanomyces astaci]|eukprot:XP_009841544.1 hypothetical protein H257_15220 [Aphanomyces astaci]
MSVKRLGGYGLDSLHRAKCNCGHLHRGCDYDCEEDRASTGGHDLIREGCLHFRHRGHRRCHGRSRHDEDDHREFCETSNVERSRLSHAHQEHVNAGDALLGHP